MLTTKENEVEYHPFQPFVPANAKVLFMGSFPPQKKRWSMDFFYPNYINDHWRIIGKLFFDDKEHFVDVEDKTFRIDDIKTFLYQTGIAYYDTATAVRRLKNNASDKYLEVVIPTDVQALVLKLPELRVIVTTGELATETLSRSLHVDQIPKVGGCIEVPSLFMRQIAGSPVYLYRLPSSSRAYPLAFDKKVDAYKKMFVFAGLLNDARPS